MGLFGFGGQDRNKPVYLYEISTGKLTPCARPNWKKCKDHPPTRFTDNPTKVAAKGKFMGSEFIPEAEDARNMSLEDYEAATDGFKLTKDEWNYLADVVGTDPDQWIMKKQNRDEILADRKAAARTKKPKSGYKQASADDPTPEELDYITDVIGANPDTYWDKHKDEFIARRKK